MPRNCWTRCNKTFPCSFPAREKTREIESRETSRCLEKQAISALPRKMIYKLKFKTKHEFLIGITQIQNALNSDFRCAMQYRTHEVGADFDTYVASIYDDRIVFMIENGAHLSYIDSVNLTKSPVYMRLLDYCW